MIISKQVIYRLQYYNLQTLEDYQFHKKMSYFCCNRNRNRPCVSVIFALASKLGLHLDKLPNPGYVINLLKSYNKDWHRHTDECILFVVLIFIYILCSYKLVFWYTLKSSLNLANLPFVIYNAIHKNL